MDLSAIIIALAAHHQVYDETRLRYVSDDISAAASTAPAFCGEDDAAVDASALALVAVADHESGWELRVQNCSFRPSPALTLWQLEFYPNHTRQELCTYDAVAAVVAAQHLAHYRHCGSSLCMFRGYASGDSSLPSKAARELDAGFWRLLTREHLTVSYRDGCLTAARTS